MLRASRGTPQTCKSLGSSRVPYWFPSPFVMPPPPTRKSSPGQSGKLACIITKSNWNYCPKLTIFLLILGQLGIWDPRGHATLRLIPTLKKKRSGNPSSSENLSHSNFPLESYGVQIEIFWAIYGPYWCHNHVWCLNLKITYRMRNSWKCSRENRLVCQETWQPLAVLHSQFSSCRPDSSSAL